MRLQVATGGGGGSDSGCGFGCMQNAPRRKVQRVNQNVIKSFGKTEDGEHEREQEKERVVGGGGVRDHGQEHYNHGTWSHCSPAARSRARQLSFISGLMDPAPPALIARICLASAAAAATASTATHALHPIKFCSIARNAPPPTPSLYLAVALYPAGRWHSTILTPNCEAAHLQ